jgi:hypothetical protein
MITKRYRILNLNVILSSDSERFVDTFDMDYSFFATSSDSQSRELSFLFHDNGGRSPSLSINGAFYPLGGHPDPPVRAYQIITQTLMREIKGFSIIHAGVVAKGDRAHVISGPSGSGKSTLIAGLLKSDFHFLSDDFCPIHEETRQVHPFPRTIWFVKPNDDSPGPEGEQIFRTMLHRRKVPLRLEHLKARIATKPYTIRSLICLDPGGKADRCGTIRVALKKGEEKPFLKAVSDLESVVLERLREESSIWLVRYPRDQHLTLQMNQLLAAMAPYIRDAYKVDLFAPDFSKKPSLTSIPRHQAVHRLMSELKDFPVKPGAYYMKLNELLEGVSCYRLSTGKLDQMKELALGTIEGDLS